MEGTVKKCNITKQCFEKDVKPWVIKAFQMRGYKVTYIGDSIVIERQGKNNVMQVDK